MYRNVKQLLLTGAAVAMLSACTQNQVDRLRDVGKEPEMAKMDATKPGSEPISWPKAPQTNERMITSNSLWKSGSRDFFRDQRARQVGDILMVHVQVDDEAALDNKTETKRADDQSLGVPNLFGVENKLFGALPGGADPSNLLGVNGSADTSGEGTIARGEKVNTELAAVVTDILDNGNLVIYGSQEIRVNYEVRQLTVQGVINPENLSTDNSIDASRIAEARISYGGKGLISNVQQPRLGHQVVDILSPF